MNMNKRMTLGMMALGVITCIALKNYLAAAWALCCVLSEASKK